MEIQADGFILSHDAGEASQVNIYWICRDERIPIAVKHKKPRGGYKLEWLCGDAERKAYEMSMTDKAHELILKYTWRAVPDGQTMFDITIVL
jgi:hypothetical protein